MFGISPIRYSCLLMYFINVVSFSSFFVKSIFEMLTVRRQQLSFSTEKWISMGNIQYFEKQISFGWESTLLYHLSYKDDMFHNTCNIQSFINFWASLISYIKLPNSSYFQTIYACMYDLNTMKSSVDYKKHPTVDFVYNFFAKMSCKCWIRAMCTSVMFVLYLSA